MRLAATLLGSTGHETGNVDIVSEGNWAHLMQVIAMDDPILAGAGNTVSQLFTAKIRLHKEQP